jgi:hypothetical protein
MSRRSFVPLAEVLMERQSERKYEGSVLIHVDAAFGRLCDALEETSDFGTTADLMVALARVLEVRNELRNAPQRARNSEE